MKAPSVKPVRCAIYTRVSTEHGLDQEFNSLDAQYEAANVSSSELQLSRQRWIHCSTLASRNLLRNSEIQPLRKTTFARALMA